SDLALDGNAAHDIANQLIQTGHVNRPYLGVTYQQLDETAAAANSLVVGALVTDVSSGSPADRAGIKAHDVVTKVNDQAIDDDHPLKDVLRQFAPGTRVSVTLPLKLARTLRRPPMTIANELVAAMALPSSFGRTAVAPPGFINVTLDPAWLQAQLAPIAGAGEQWGRSELGRGIRVQVEFVSSNPTGPMLFSHARGAVVGDVVARVLEADGYAVQREYYVNDQGKQIRLFGDSIRARMLGEPTPEGGYSG